MKSFNITIFFVVFVNLIVNAQTVTGTIIDQDGYGVPKLKVQLYAGINDYVTTTTSDGSFIFTNVTSVKESELPSGYNISNNYPNPFNPRTRIEIALPKTSNVRIEVFNINGQRVGSVIEKDYDAGIQVVELEMKGLSNGVYFVRFTIDNNYLAIRKVMLLYGSNHLNTTSNTLITPLGKVTSSVELDSLVVTGAILPKHVFTSLPQLIGDTVNVGNLTVNIFGERCPGFPTVEYGGKIYNTIVVDSQCWLKENLDIGIMIQGNQNQKNNNTIEKYCYNNDIANCNTYGGLYQWNEAMQYSTTPGTQGICPPGWNIPTEVENLALRISLNNDGNALKAIGEGNGDGTGTNTSGFSALLAGCRVNDSNFDYLGKDTYFWSSTVSSTTNAKYIRLRDSYGSITLSNQSKDYGLSVRCTKDLAVPPKAPTLITPAHNAMGQPINPTFTWNKSGGARSYLFVLLDQFGHSTLISLSGLIDTSIQISGLKHYSTYQWRVKAENGYGSSNWSTTWKFQTIPGVMNIPCPGLPTVTYSGKTYNTVLIGNQCWLKENLDVGVMIYSTSSGFQQTNNGIIEKYCYDNNPNSCITYGGLYEWTEAMQYNTSPGTRGICPPEWHIPTKDEFEILRNTVGDGGSRALLKQGQGIGTNTSGFSAIFTGIRAANGGFEFLGETSSFYSSTQSDEISSIFMVLGKIDNIIYIQNSNKQSGRAIRCITYIDSIPRVPILSTPQNNSANQSINPLFEWIQVGYSPGIKTYTLQVSTNNLFTSFVYNQSGLTNTSQQISGLNPSTQYYWRVRATNSFGTSEWSAIWSFTTTGEIPSLPVLIFPEDFAIGQSIHPTFSWSSSGATSYTLQVSTESNFTSFIYNQSGLTNTSQQISGLNYLTKNYWRVNATNSYGTSNWSRVSNFTTTIAAPILISPEDNAAGQNINPTLIWSCFGATSYTLQVSTDSLFTSLFYHQSGLTDTSKQIGTLSNLTKYYWRVKAASIYGTSNWSNVWKFTTNEIPHVCGDSILYYGKTYNTVLIGNQCWFKENLDVGLMIHGSINSSNNGVIEKYCVYNNIDNCSIYGGLYRWIEAMNYTTNPETQGICPPGWHIPTITEFEILKSSVSNDGNALKAIGAGTGTNTSGFSALLAGFRDATGGFQQFNMTAFFLSSSENGSLDAEVMSLPHTGGSINFYTLFKDWGLSVRCIKD